MSTHALSDEDDRFLSGQMGHRPEVGRVSLGGRVSRFASVAMRVGERVFAGPQDWRPLAGRMPDLPTERTRSRASAQADVPAPLKPAALDAQAVRLALAAAGQDSRAFEDAKRDIASLGLTSEIVGLAILTPSARILGKMWEDDTASFNQVTLGIWRLRQLQDSLRDERSLSAAPQTAGSGGAHVICLATAPGERHSFGLSVVAGLFEAAGWQALVQPCDDCQSLIAEVSSTRVDVVGLTVTGQSLLDSVAGVIRQIRAASLNPEVRIVLGGGLIAATPDCNTLLDRTGADAALADACDAVEQIEALLVSKGAHASSLA